MKMADLSDFKRGQIVDARMAGANKNRWIIWCSKEYCLESNENIWERRNILTEAKLWKKVKVVW